MTKKARKRFFFTSLRNHYLASYFNHHGSHHKTGGRSEQGSTISKHHFHFDASGSMKGQIGGRGKTDIAKDVLIKLIEDLPAGINVGLVSYGHRRKGDCNDVEELAPLAKLNKQDLIDKIRALKPKGKTTYQSLS